MAHVVGFLLCLNQVIMKLIICFTFFMLVISSLCFADEMPKELNGVNADTTTNLTPLGEKIDPLITQAEALFASNKITELKSSNVKCV